MKLEYCANNSGGRWWLNDEHWKALEATGWSVEWVANEKTTGLLAPGADGRWLGALAKSASLECETPADGIRSFEKITGLDASDEGCNCCGPPHAFSWDAGKEHGYVSGKEIADLLMNRPDLSGLSRRELLERLTGGK